MLDLGDMLLLVDLFMCWWGLLLGQGLPKMFREGWACLESHGVGILVDYSGSGSLNTDVHATP
jgi:hypothetical protein